MCCPCLCSADEVRAAVLAILRAYILSYIGRPIYSLNAHMQQQARQQQQQQQGESKLGMKPAQPSAAFQSGRLASREVWSAACLVHLAITVEAKLSQARGVPQRAVLPRCVLQEVPQIVQVELLPLQLATLMSVSCFLRSAPEAAAQLSGPLAQVGLQFRLQQTTHH